MQQGSTLNQATVFHTTAGKQTAAGLRGNILVVYFYPKDDTPGCTTEGKDFTAAQDHFAAAGCRIIGVSKDSLDAHNTFCTKYGFNFPLASDQDGTLCELFGVWKEKNMYGKTYMGIERSTFVFDSNGVCVKVWRKVKVPKHVQEVLAVVNQLKNA